MQISSPPSIAAETSCMFSSVAKVQALFRQRQQAPRILIVRNDGLGDLILTLPLVSALRAQFPQAVLYLLCDRNLAPLAQMLPALDGVVEDPGVLLKRHAGRMTPALRQAGRQRLREELRHLNFDLAIFAYAESPSAALIQATGIPWRLGPLRRRFFWRFNLWATASRKGSAKAEWEMNLDLLSVLGLPMAYHPPQLALPALDPPAASLLAASAGYVVLHPYKRAATALSWPLEHFLSLAQAFLAQGLEVVAVGDAADAPVLEATFAALPQVRLLTGLALPQLAALLAGAKLFVGNSSGPLHLAGLVGTPHVGFFPQNRVSAPARWRTLPNPQAPQAYQTYLRQPAFPRACITCAGPSCPYYNCVAAISLQEALEAAQSWLSPK